MRVLISILIEMIRQTSQLQKKIRTFLLIRLVIAKPSVGIASPTSMRTEIS